LLKQKNNNDYQWRDIGTPLVKPEKVSLEELTSVILMIEKIKSLVIGFKKTIEGRKDV